LDALKVNIVNNTIVSNDSTASAGILFTSLFAPLASSQGTNCTANNGAQSCPQPAGLVSVTNSAVFAANLPATITCPQGNGSGGTGACTPASFWGIGVRGDTRPNSHSGGILAATYSVITDAADYPGLNNLASNPTVISQYCNGSRVPPELGSMGYQVPPGTNE